MCGLCIGSGVATDALVTTLRAHRRRQALAQIARRSARAEDFCLARYVPGGFSAGLLLVSR